jgi:hypothetical protein
MSKKRMEDWHSFHGQRKARGFLERPSAERASYVIDQKPAKNDAGTANRALSFRRTLFKLGLIDSSGCDRCEQASEVASCSL